jgi:hypothetical protein
LGGELTHAARRAAINREVVAPPQKRLIVAGGCRATVARPFPIRFAGAIAYG